jgi:DNA-binding NtrC family response regulator
MPLQRSSIPVPQPAVSDHPPVLYIGSNRRERSAVARALAALGLDGYWTTSTRDAFAALARTPHLVVLDLKRDDALKTARSIRVLHPEASLIGLADDARSPHVRALAREGVLEVASKPLNGAEFAAAMDRAKALRLSSTIPRSAFFADEAVFVKAPAMQLAVDRAWRAAVSARPVLITGEADTGREFLSRTFHRVAGHDPSTFVAVDCANLAAADIEAQFFGFRVSSVSSGTIGQRITPWSPLYRAQGGTLFLKNFPMLPAATRATLARALQLRHARLDGGRVTQLRFRLVVSSGATRREALACSDLDADVPFVCVSVPPLRQRREDLMLLASHLTEQLCEQMDASPKALTSTAAALLAALPWRGNVAELRTLLRHVIPRVRGRVIRLDDLLPHLRLDAVRFARETETFQEARTRFERDYIAATIERSRGHIADAARVLGVLRPNLHRQMRRLGIPASIVQHQSASSRKGASDE